MEVPLLTPSLAQQIARETTDIIGYNVVITDRDGIVLGSGDPAREGTFHEASMEVVRTERLATHTAAQARQLAGVRHGITLPVLLDGELVGTVGITGSPTQVRRFGLVVRNQTELLLRESSLITSRLVREKAVTDLLQDIAHHDPTIVAPQQMQAAGDELGYDLTLPRVALVIDLEHVAAARVPAVLRTVRQVFHDPQDIVGTLGRSHVAVLHRLLRDTDASAALAAARRVAASLGAEHGAGHRVGAGDPANSVAQLRDSHADALSAVRLAARDDDRAEPVAHIAEFRLHQLLATVGVRTRTRFANAVLGALPLQPDWDVLRTTLLAWCEQGFHLVRTAQVLRVHRNTLVYRLRKIERILGRELRDHRYALALHMACLVPEATPEPGRRS
jgi:carbohydrate diacid regulator